MATDNLQQYFREQQVSLQWLPVLRALAAEMPLHFESENLRLLFSNVGGGMAREAQELFHDAHSLPQLEECLNGFWSRINWGWIGLAEVNDCIEIQHHAVPLAESFGDEALHWSVGLLEGFYQTVFTGLGASKTMVTRCVAHSAGGMDITLRFGRQDA